MRARVPLTTSFPGRKAGRAGVPMGVPAGVLAGILAVILLMVQPCARDAFAAPQIGGRQTTYTLKVTCVIDNAGDYPAETAGRFTYGYNTFTELYLRSSSSGIYVPKLDYDSDGMVKHPMTWTNGQTVTLRVSATAKPVFMFEPTDATYAGLSLTSVNYGAGTQAYVYTNQGRAYVSCTTPNWVSMQNTTGEITLHFHYSGPMQVRPEEYGMELGGSKQIDYLGDGVVNPDTTRCGENDYRLYITAETGAETECHYRSKNIIFVLDVSGSMAYSLGTSTRIDVLKAKVTQMLAALSEDPDNRYSVVSFASGASRDLVWGTAAQARTVVNGLRANGGTGYYSAFDCVAGLVGDPERDNIVIFVSDGLPTYTPYDVIHGNSSGTSYETPVAYIYSAMAAQGLGGVDGFYSVFIGSGNSGASMLENVTQFVSVSDERASVKVTDEIEFQKVITAITDKLQRPRVTVTLSDTLTAYVAYRPGSARLTRRVEGGSREVLVNGRDYSLTYDAAEKRVVAVLTEAGTAYTAYTLSFDVATSATAVEEWLDTGGVYPHVGQAGTDYGPTGNATSAGQAGFFSNETASVSLSWFGGGEERILARPVVQVVFNPVTEADICAHVTLYNMELMQNMFFFELLDDDGALIAVAGNGTDGDIGFPKLEYNTDGTWHYTVRQLVPGRNSALWIPYMTFDTTEFDVWVTARVTADENGAALGTEVTVEYGEEPRFICEYALRTTQQFK